MLTLPAHAAQTDIHGPLGSIVFGTSVTVLPNGNFVVTDPDGPVSNVGAVYLYDPNGTLISTLMGSNLNDNVGNNGITVVGGSNFVVRSTRWRNGAATQAGAVTWVNGSTGMGPGTTLVSASNSLVGTTSDDAVGIGGVTALSNGNYVVTSLNWHNGAIANAGAVTWGNGSSGIVGAVSISNSLVGITAIDLLGYGGVTALSNGNYVVASPYFNNGVAGAMYGAATWGNGSSGTTGAMSASNSLVGTTVNDRVGGQVIALKGNGNYVVRSIQWNNGTTANAGAATWGNGSSGVTGAVSASNSLIGTTANDEVGGGGHDGITALTNGNYVVASPSWHNGTIANAGAATWGNGSNGVKGAVSASNSLVGTTVNDSVGVGSNAFRCVTPLSNGNYVVISPYWNNAIAGGQFGAVTWGNGSSGIVAAVSPSNSLIGAFANDHIGNYGVTALSNGNYVVASAEWNSNVGAATWGNGGSGSTGIVQCCGSLIGSASGDKVGAAVTALSNGNYVVSSPSWNGNLGAATWSDGIGGGPVGFVGASNSLVGGNAFDLSDIVVSALSNGNYVALNESWYNGATADAGAATWSNGSAGITGPVSVSNSLVGTRANDHVGGTFGGATALSDGNYVIASEDWNNGATTRAGAVTLASSRFRLKGTIQPWNSVLGMAINGGSSMTYDYDAVRHRLVVGRPAENIVSLFTMDQIFAADFDP